MFDEGWIMDGWMMDKNVINVKNENKFSKAIKSCGSKLKDIVPQRGFLMEAMMLLLSLTRG